jgi:hypothetical protein
MPNVNINGLRELPSTVKSAAPLAVFNDVKFGNGAISFNVIPNVSANSSEIILLARFPESINALTLTPFITTGQKVLYFTASALIELANLISASDEM